MKKYEAHSLIITNSRRALIRQVGSDDLIERKKVVNVVQTIKTNQLMQKVMKNKISRFSDKFIYNFSKVVPSAVDFPARSFLPKAHEFVNALWEVTGVSRPWAKPLGRGGKCGRKRMTESFPDQMAFLVDLKEFAVNVAFF